MAAAAVLTQIPSSFVYEDLITHVQSIQTEMMKMETALDLQLQGNKAPVEVKSRRFRFADPFGNQTKIQCFDHESIVKVIKNYKKNYVPRYLQRWIQLGTIDERGISPLSEADLRLSVSDLAEDELFVSYGRVIVWIGRREAPFSHSITINVLLTDNLEAIQAKIKRERLFTEIEVKSAVFSEDRYPSSMQWAGGSLLKPEDTVMSSQLYQEHRVLLARLDYNKVHAKTVEDFAICVETLTGKRIYLNVNANMEIWTVKLLLHEVEGISPDQQRLVSAGRRLEDDNQTLSDCNIRQGDTMHLVLRLGGGMYHFTSGRQDLNKMPPKSAEAVRNMLAFKVDHAKKGRTSSPAELQNAILQARTVLSQLYQQTQRCLFANDTPHLRKVILPTPLVDVDHSESESDDEDAVSPNH